MGLGEMVERKSLRLYKLEAEKEKIEYEYHLAYLNHEKMIRAKGEYKFLFRMSLLYFIAIILVIGFAYFIAYMAESNILVNLIIPACFMISLVIGFLWLGIMWKTLRYGVFFRKRQRKAREAENTLFAVSQKLNMCQIKIDTLKEEIDREDEAKAKEMSSMTEGEWKQADIQEHQEQLGLQIIKEDIKYKKKGIGDRIHRLEKEKKEEENRLENLLRKEYKNEKERKRYGCLALISAGLVAILGFFQTLNIDIFMTTLARSLLLLLPFVLVIPYSIAWLAKSMNTFWGEELFICKFIFREIYESSLTVQIKNSRENLQKLSDELKKQEQELEGLERI